MKITASVRTKSEVLKEQEEYDSRIKVLKDKYDEQEKQYSQKIHDVEQSIEDIVADKLSLFPSLGLEVSADVGFGEVSVKVATDQSKLFDKSVALSWNWNARLDEKTGEIKKESGSWSGLQAITADQIDFLKQSVAALEILNSLDWADILGVDVPQYSEYIDRENAQELSQLRRNRPNFRQQLDEAEIAEIMGTDALVKGVRDAGKLYRGVVWFNVISETPSMYVVGEVSDYYLSQAREGNKTYEQVVDNAKQSSYKIKKETFFKNLSYPLSIITE